MGIHCLLPFLPKLKTFGRPARLLSFCGAIEEIQKESKLQPCPRIYSFGSSYTGSRSFRYKVVSIQNTILERTQTSVVNKANPYLREPPHVSKPPTQWEHVNETKFWFGLFIENRDLYKWFWDFFYKSSAYYTYDQETQILSIMSCKLVKQRTREEIAVILARG